MCSIIEDEHLIIHAYQYIHMYKCIPQGVLAMLLFSVLTAQTTDSIDIQIYRYACVIGT